MHSLLKSRINHTCILTEKFFRCDKLVGTCCKLFLVVKAFDVQEKKGFFLTSFWIRYKKIDYPNLPPYDRFYSYLKDINVLDVDGEGQQNYQCLQEVWQSEGMTLFRDLFGMVQ